MYMTKLVPEDTIEREVYHLYPTHGLLNDPNGLVYFKDQYHVFFQWNNQAVNHKYKEWGHFVSDDLKHWQRLDNALYPSLPEDSAGIYSGSAIVKDDKLYLFYTGNVRDDDGHSVASHQMWAVSEDGIHFEKLGELFEHPEGYTRHVRDPRVWQGKNGHYYLIVGAQRQVDLTGDILIYESSDFKTWQLRGSLIEDVLLDVRGYMIECPDLFVVDGHTVLAFSPQGLEPDAIHHRYENIHNTGYVIGRFDENTARFVPETSFTEMDRGFEFYAPQTMHVPHDGTVRQILWAWAGMMTPEREMMVPTIKDGWLHVLTVPRELHVTDALKLTQKPIDEILRVKPVRDLVDPPVGQYTLNTTDNWQLTLGEDFEITRTDNTIIMRRRQWESNLWETRQITGDVDQVTLIIDQDIVELYTDGYQQVMTARYFK